MKGSMSTRPSEVTLELSFAGGNYSPIQISYLGETSYVLSCDEGPDQMTPLFRLDSTCGYPHSGWI
jgi:hypothetical protein